MGNWSYLHCPKPQDYELDRIEDGKYHYKLIKPHKNKRDELILEDDIQNVVKEIWRQSKEALVDTYGEEFYERIKIEMKIEEFLQRSICFYQIELQGEIYKMEHRQ